MYFWSPLSKSNLISGSVMLKRTVNGVKARGRLCLKPFEGLRQVVVLFDLDGPSDVQKKWWATWLFQDSPKTFYAHGVKCIGKLKVNKSVRLFPYTVDSEATLAFRKLNFGNDLYKLVHHHSLKKINWDRAQFLPLFLRLVMITSPQRSCSRQLTKISWRSWYWWELNFFHFIFLDLRLNPSSSSELSAPLLCYPAVLSSYPVQFPLADVQCETCRVTSSAFSWHWRGCWSVQNRGKK